MKSITAGNNSLLFLLGLFPGAANAKCTELFAAAHPNAEVALVCQDFVGDPKLHAIVYGCGAVNQDSEVPAGFSSQSFTEKCKAHLTDATTYTCYQLTEGADYSSFTSSVDPALACTTSNTFDSPKYQYLQTTAEYTHGGGSGSQSTDVPNVRATFDEALVTEAYYTVIVTEDKTFTPNTASPEGTQTETTEMEENSPLTHSATTAPISRPQDMADNNEGLVVQIGSESIIGASSGASIFRPLSVVVALVGVSTVMF